MLSQNLGKKTLTFLNHEDFLKARDIAGKLDKERGIIAVENEYIMKSAENRALKMVEKIWAAIGEIFASIF